MALIIPPNLSRSESFFDRFPNEILAQVLSYLTPTTLYKLSRLCSRFKMLSEPDLAAKLRLYTYTGLESLRRFLRAILRHPGLGKFVEIVDLQPDSFNKRQDQWWFSMIEEHVPDRQLFYVALQKAGFPDSREAWSDVFYRFSMPCGRQALDKHQLSPSPYQIVRRIDHPLQTIQHDWETTSTSARRDALTALLLAWLPNIRRLYTDTWHRGRHLTQFFDRSMANAGEHTQLEYRGPELSSTLSSTVCAITEIAYHPVFNSPFFYNRCGSHVCDIWPFLALPYIERLEASKLVGPSDVIDFYPAALHSFYPQSGISPRLRYTAVKILHLRSCAIGTQYLQHILSSTRRLRSFHYQHDNLMVSEAGKSVHFAAKAIKQLLLRYAKDTLVHLSLARSPVRLGAQHGQQAQPMGPLRDFKALKYVYASFYLLVNPKADPCPYILRDLLPRSLQRLILYDVLDPANPGNPFATKIYVPYLLAIARSRFECVPQFRNLTVGAWKMKDLIAFRNGEEESFSESNEEFIKINTAGNEDLLQLCEACGTASIELELRMFTEGQTDRTYAPPD